MFYKYGQRSCRVLVKKGLNLMSMYWRRPGWKIFLCPLFLKREMATKKVMGLFMGVPWPEIIMKHSVYIQVCFGP